MLNRLYVLSPPKIVAALSVLVKQKSIINCTFSTNAEPNEFKMIPSNRTKIPAPNTVA